MTIRSMYIALVLFLVGMLAVQIGIRAIEKPPHNVVAVWKNRPADLAEAKGLAKRIVVGKVTSIEQAEPIRVKIDEEPGGYDEVPIEVVTIEIEKILKGKGAAKEKVNVFRTGSSSAERPDQRPPPPDSQLPPKPEGGVDKPARPQASPQSVFALEGDPPYAVGDEVILLLMEGPTVKVKGKSVKTEAPISPAGRFKVKKDGTIEPAAGSGLGFKQRGKSRAALERELRGRPE